MKKYFWIFLVLLTGCVSFDNTESDEIEYLNRDAKYIQSANEEYASGRYKFIIVPETCTFDTLDEKNIYDIKSFTITRDDQFIPVINIVLSDIDGYEKTISEIIGNKDSYFRFWKLFQPYLYYYEGWNGEIHRTNLVNTDLKNDKIEKGMYCIDTSTFTMYNNQLFLINLYNAKKYLFFTDFIQIAGVKENRDRPVKNKWNSLNEPDSVILIPQSMSEYIFGGIKRNSYIFEYQYDICYESYTVFDQTTGEVEVMQFVLQDDLGLIIPGDIITYSTANDEYSIQKYEFNSNILTKYIGTTKITLSNGHVVNRPLLVTIPFNTKDPNVIFE